MVFDILKLFTAGIEHFVEFAFDLGLEIGFDLIDLGEFSKGPTAIGFEVVDAWHPIGIQWH
jgi:hypothetical protein